MAEEPLTSEGGASGDSGIGSQGVGGAFIVRLPCGPSSVYLRQDMGGAGPRVWEQAWFIAHQSISDGWEHTAPDSLSGTPAYWDLMNALVYKLGLFAHFLVTQEGGPLASCPRVCRPGHRARDRHSVPPAPGGGGAPHTALNGGGLPHFLTLQNPTSQIPADVLLPLTLNDAAAPPNA